MASGTATLEYTTARYMPPGSPVYKGDLALFPGMTANCTIVTNRKEDTLRVPSAALRFNPSAFVPVEDKKPAAGAPAGTLRAAAGPSGAARGMVARRDDRLWTLANGKPKAVSCTAGVSDGSFTEVSGEAVTEGLVVLTGVDDFKKALNPGASPLGGGMRH